MSDMQAELARQAEVQERLERLMAELLASEGVRSYLGPLGLKQLDFIVNARKVSDAALIQQGLAEAMNALSTCGLAHTDLLDVLNQTTLGVLIGELSKRLGFYLLEKQSATAAPTPGEGDMTDATSAGVQP